MSDFPKFRISGDETTSNRSATPSPLRAISPEVIWKGAAAFLALVFLVVWIRGRSGGSGDPIQNVVSQTTVMDAAITELRSQAKLVVMDARVTVNVEIENSASLEWGPLKIQRGTTRVNLRSANNRVQYVLSLSEIQDGNVHFDPVINELTISLAPPRVDRDMVDVDPTPEIKTAVGWARVDSRSGETARRAAREAMRPAAIHEAEGEVYLRSATDAAKDAVTKLLRPVLAQSAPRAHVTVNFR